MNLNVLNFIYNFNSSNTIIFNIYRFHYYFFHEQNIVFYYYMFSIPSI